ncbi:MULTISPECIES: RagB/SusD family nutrient uptake outer membrane protein [Chryseobacterium]|uniref:RagB/SusD family nutrient uptake outer membrane protein n=1 Tax=Chryseobacterium TaxID=59732 RepID=UPI000D3B5E74|nr:MULTISPECIES: RagB/SusD family nutrient uptake outer membrane protein [Chryseobacterium]PTT70027.1 RagB/SusD family nutrient uptake outer membrane protein [Chryseobacterium sp. HMWF001]PVV61970.1 RagB/SusD family nutrient uptake outer membrane protein [Chryseobacterium sp. HMWF035]WBX95638.1 RagB/SusD family nutrient uptake outer membrane protein [Chryseobacterium gambrini]
MKNNILKYAFICLSAGTLLTSCSNDFIETEFFQSIEQRPLVSIEEMESTVRGQYNAMRSASYYGCDFPMIAEIRSDNMFSNNASGYYNTVSNYSMLSNDAYASGPYTQMYRVIALANTVINNQPASPLTWKVSSDPATITAKANYLKGQSYAARALALFDALRLYGQEYAGGTLGVVVPTKYDPTSLQARSSVAQTRTQIESDFDQALILMSPTLDATDKTVLNTISVKTLMSRYYLYKGDYARVRTLVNEIVAANKYSVIGRGDYANSFRSSSAQNSMFELAIGTLGDLGTTSTSYKLLVAPNGYGNMKVLSALRASYNANDIRLAGITTGLVLNGKYINTFDNIKLVRYEEALLNGAEAELNAGGTPSKAVTYYNLILQNRILNYVPVTSVTLNDIYQEKKKEFVGEGFGMFDLLRRGQSITQRNTSGVAGTVRNVGNNLLAFPIPRAEINVPGTPVVQNPGYSN